MEVYLISDTHFNHDNIATYCDRPKDFTERIIREWNGVVKHDDLVIHLGDVLIGNRRSVDSLMAVLPGRKILVRGNHDRQHSNTWWMEHGFSFACDGMKFRNCWLTHEPSTSLADGCELNIHGHLHNIWHGFYHAPPVREIPHGATICVHGMEPFTCRLCFPLPTPTKLHKPWQRLFAIEYTDYRPVEFDKFVQHPKKYLATGLGD